MPTVEYLKHINVITDDLLRNLKFYGGMLGLRVVHGPFAVFGPEMAEAFDIVNTDTEIPLPVEVACFFKGKEEEHDEEDVVLNLGWWQRPPSEGSPYSNPWNLGHQRVNFRVSRLDECYEELSRRGVVFHSEPVDLGVGDGVRACFFEDPDGTRLALVEADVQPSRSDDPGIRRVHSVTTTVQNLEASLDLYENILGMSVVRGPFVLEGPAVAQAMGLEDTRMKARGVWLRPGGTSDERALIELLEWENPRSGGDPYPLTTETGGAFANHTGIPRIAFWVDDVQRRYREIKDAGIRFISPPVVTDMGPDCSYCCFVTEDGTVLQLYRYVHGEEAPRPGALMNLMYE